MDEDIFAYHQHYWSVARTDVLLTIAKDRSYKASWKKRGGIGAFMMLARKWDRLEAFMEHEFRYDVFAGVEAGPGGEDGTVLAEIRDLRRYLMNVEAEMAQRGVVELSTARDSSITDEEMETIRALRDGTARVVMVRGGLSHAQQTMKEDTLPLPVGTQCEVLFMGDLVSARVLSYTKTGVEYEYTLEDEAGNPYKRRRHQIRVADPAPAPSEAPGEPVAAPYEPSEPPADTTLPADSPVAGDSSLPFSWETRREPVGLTEAEYQRLSGEQIMRGPLSGSMWRDLYQEAEGDTHKWMMQPEYREEYGR